MNKPRVEYLVHPDNLVTEGGFGCLVAIFGHPRLGDIDHTNETSCFIRTSRVLHIFDDGEFETLNTIYVPRAG